MARVRIELDGKAMWGTLAGDAIVLDGGGAVAADGAAYLAPVEPTKIIADPPHVPQPGRGVRRAHPARAVVLHEAAVDAQRPPRRAAAAARRALPQLRGRGRRSSSAARMHGVPESEVLDYVAGYAPVNDVGLHDFRHADRGSMLRVKGQDGFCPIGPALTPADEFDPTDYTLRTYLNGEVVQEGGADDLHLADRATCSPTSAARSRSSPATSCSRGTPANSRPMEPGDVVEVEVSGLGPAAQHRRRLGRRPERPGRPAAGLRQHAPRRARHARGRGRARRGRRRERHVISTCDASTTSACASPTSTRRPPRWAIQFGLHRDGAPRRPRAYLALRLRAVLPRARRRTSRPGHDHTGFELRRGTARSTTPPRHLARPRRRLRGARRRACTSPTRTATASSCCPTASPTDRRPADRAQHVDARAASSPRKLGHVNCLTGDLARCGVLLRGRARHAAHRLARRRRRLVPRQRRPPRDGARRQGLRALPPPRLRVRRLGQARRDVRPPRPARPLARAGGPCGTASARTSAATCASPRRSASSSSTATWSSSRPTTSRASGPTTGTRRTPGGRCRRARTSASIAAAIESERESLETLGHPLAPLARTERHGDQTEGTTRPAPAPGKQFLDGLRGDAREVWLNGEKITHPLEHPQLRRRGRSRSPASSTSSTSTPTRCSRRRPTTARLVNVTHLIPRTQEDLERRAGAHSS